MSFETQCQDSGKSIGDSLAARAAPLEIPSVGVAECKEPTGAAFIFISLSVSSGPAVAAVVVLRLLLLLWPSVVASSLGSPVIQ